MKTILFEGINRVGKTSILNALSYELEKASFNNICNVVTEVNYSDLGKDVCNKLVKEKRYDDYTSYLLYMAIRRRNYEVIENYKNNYRGRNVYTLIDRGILSTMVYQRNAFLSLENMYLDIQNHLKDRFLKPDVVFYIKRNLYDVIDLSKEKGISEEKIVENIMRYEKAISFLRNKRWNIIELKNENIKETTLTCFNYIQNN